MFTAPEASPREASSATLAGPLSLTLSPLTRGEGKQPRHLAAYPTDETARREVIEFIRPFVGIRQPRPAPACHPKRRALESRRGRSEAARPAHAGRSILPSGRRAKRPSSRACTGSTLAQGQPPKPELWKSMIACRISSRVLITNGP